MAFLEECTDEKLDWLSEEIHELCLAFQEGNGESEFIDFLNELAASRPACKSFSGDLKLTIEAIKEFDND